VLGLSRGDLRLDVAARSLALLALAVPTLWFGDSTSVLGLITLGLLWAGASLWPLQGLSRTAVDLTEASLVGVIAGLTVGGTPSLLAAICVPQLTTGLRAGLSTAMRTLAAGLVGVVASAWVYNGLSASRAADILTWLVAALGVTLVSGSLHSGWEIEVDALRPYRDARALMRELIGLSGGLKSGLDPESLAARVLRTVGDAMPASALALVVRREEVLIPMASTGPTGPDGQGQPLDDHMVDDLADLAGEALTARSLLVGAHGFALPLETDAGPVAVIVGHTSPEFPLDPVTVHRTLAGLRSPLEADAVRLDAALLFAAFRDEATRDERQRLAREMHDGVAQDIASLGYVVDALSAGETDPKRAELLKDLRARVTAVVAEVRRSVHKLRSQAEASESLGAAISSLARHLSERTGVPIQVSVNEGTTRLRPEVEAELLRITQEALNNSVKHAKPTEITVRCEVAPPRARIEVSDDGAGLGHARPDSYGLTIMGERARLIGAELEIGTGPAGGVAVIVSLPGVSSALAED